jgi:hypothetical protein
VDSQFELHQAFVHRIVDQDLGGKLRPLVGREFGQAAAAADRADDVGGGIEPANWDAVLAGEFTERLVVGVIAPFLRPVDLQRKGGEIDLAPVVAIHGGLIPGLELLEAEHEGDAAGEEDLQQLQLDGVVALNGVRFAHIHRAGTRQIGDYLGVGKFLAPDQVEPEFRRNGGTLGHSAARRQESQQGAGQHEGEAPRSAGGESGGKEEAHPGRLAGTARLTRTLWRERPNSKRPPK